MAANAVSSKPGAPAHTMGIAAVGATSIAWRDVACVDDPLDPAARQAHGQAMGVEGGGCRDAGDDGRGDTGDQAGLGLDA